jgi:hypothetical protein
MIPPRALLAALLCPLLACGSDPPPEAPPPAECGPEMARIRLQNGTAFCADLGPVTLASYQECVGRALCSVRPAGNGCLRDDLTTQQQPVNCVDAAQADAFCKARKMRLPSREELGAVPFGGAEGVRWVAGAVEWTATPSSPGSFIGLRYEPINRTFFHDTSVPAGAQKADLGFRCVR